MGKVKTEKAKEFSKMNRADLLELLIIQVKENEALKKAEELHEKEKEDLADKLTQANKKLNNIEISIQNAGSIAEASLQVNDVFTTAQKAAQQYIDNIKKLNTQKEVDYNEVIKNAELKADEILQEARRKAESIEMDARQKSSSIIMEAERECVKKKNEIDKYWGELSTRLETFYQSHKGLKALIQSSPK